jgi:hypothetical protein
MKGLFIIITIMLMVVSYSHSNAQRMHDSSGNHDKKQQR